MRRFLAVLALALAACAPSASGAGAGSSEPLRLCIENATSGYGTLQAQAKSVRFTVAAGETVCRSMGVTRAPFALRATTTSGGIGGPLTFGAELDPLHHHCWRWRLSNTRESVRLLPCD